MKRIERIYDFIKQESAKFTKDTLAAKEGLDAQEIADALSILRNNVSKELNELVRQEQIVKFGGPRGARKALRHRAAAGTARL